MNLRIARKVDKRRWQDERAYRRSTIEACLMRLDKHGLMAESERWFVGMMDDLATADPIGFAGMQFRAGMELVALTEQR